MTGRLAPSGRRFLPELSALAEHAVAAAGVLRERLGSTVGRPGHVAALAALAREADRLASAVTDGAARALVPPIDGDDASELASRLRDVVGATGSAGRLVNAIRPGLPDAIATALADLLVGAADSLEGAAATLTDPARAVEFARDVRRLARDGERAYAEAIGALLTTAPDAVGAVRQGEMYRSLRESLRACARAAAVVEHIALKRF